MQLVFSPVLPDRCRVFARRQDAQRAEDGGQLLQARYRKLRRGAQAVGTGEPSAAAAASAGFRPKDASGAAAPRRAPRFTSAADGRSPRTCGSLLAALDVQPRIAMAILRHSRIALTMEIYTQVPDKVTREALTRLSDWLGHDQGDGGNQ